MIAVAVDDAVSTDLEVPNWTEFKHYGSRLLRWAILTVGGITWVAFWGLVVRLHVQLGDIVSASVVSLLFVLPAIIGYLYYLRLKLPIP